MERAQYIDHTYLKAEATSKDIDKLVNEAKTYNFKTVCVNSSWVKHAKEKLGNSTVGITAVVGFPLGAMITQAKAQEAKLAIEHGADEIDMVINIGRLRDEQYEYVLNDIKSVKKAIGDKVLKVIIETALLKDYQAKKATELVLQSGADFVKTSTGFSYRGASFDDIKMMKEIVGDKIGIKAAGGVKTPEDMDKMIELGATRIGTSSGIKLIKGEEVNTGY